VAGRNVLVQSQGSPAASAVLFLGVPPLGDFGYEEIRVFGRRAIAGAPAMTPGATGVCVTLHGPRQQGAGRGRRAARSASRLETVRNSSPRGDRATGRETRCPTPVDA
jgi:hypothetical protein